MMMEGDRDDQDGCDRDGSSYSCRQGPIGDYYRQSDGSVVSGQWSVELLVIVRMFLSPMDWHGFFDEGFAVDQSYLF